MMITAFQFLTGTIRRKHLIICLKNNQSFNSLLVQLEVKQQGVKGSNPTVSIPYWYNQKFVHPYIYNKALYSFNSLLVQLEVKGSNPTWKDDVFQFLTGTIRRVDPKKIFQVALRFNSLLVQLEVFISGHKVK